MEHKQFMNLVESAKQVLLKEHHRAGDKVIVKGKMGVIVKKVGDDGETENDEIYQVRFEDGSIENVPARDMEMQGDESRKPSENEAEDITQMNETPIVGAGWIATGLKGLGLAPLVGKFIGTDDSKKADPTPTQGIYKTPTEIEKGQTKTKEPKFGGATTKLKGRQVDRKIAVRDIARGIRMGKPKPKPIRKKK